MAANNSTKFTKLDKVDINSHIYRIIEEKNPILDGETVDGFCDYSKYEITLKQSLALEKYIHIFMHEVVHAMEMAYDCPLDDEDEEIRNHKVDIIAQAIISFIRLNKKAVAMVSESYDK